MAIHRKSALILALCAVLAHAEGTGRITGFVKFPGETPPRNMFANASDPNCPRGIPQNHLLVKQETRGLKNAFVILDRHDRRVMPTRLQAELATVGCELLPRVQWVPLGTSLSVADRDRAVHHIHAVQADNTVFEAELASDSPPVRRPLVTPGLYKVNCDKHPWERAWICVSPHDSVALTDAEGRFLIKNVPAGRYHIRAWHEGWQEKGGSRDGRMEFVPMQDLREVKVTENGDTEIIFDSMAPTFEVHAPN
jgi:hypothetical protein